MSKVPMWPVSPLLKTRCQVTLQAQVSKSLGRGQGWSWSGEETHELLCHNCCLPDHVTLPLALMFEDVAVATTNFSFYDCSAVQALEVAAP